MNKFKELSEQQIIKSIKSSINLGQVLKQLECHDNNSNRNKLKEFISENNIDTSHFKKKLTKEEYEQNPKRCKQCGKIIPWEKRDNDFCNHSCSASFNNIGVIKNPEGVNGQNFIKKDIRYCVTCGKQIPTHNTKYCSLECQQKDREQWIERWKSGEESGIRGEQGISTRIRRYLFDKYNCSCQLCGWNKINEFTQKVPLQIHHIDGDCLNNKEENLQLLCPNCHSLTENFGSRNENCTRTDNRQRY